MFMFDCGCSSVVEHLSCKPKTQEYCARITKLEKNKYYNILL